MNVPSNSNPTTSGRVRYHADSAFDENSEIGITLGGTEYIMPVVEALGLANRIIFTAHDKETHYAE